MTAKVSPLVAKEVLCWVQPQGQHGLQLPWFFQPQEIDEERILPVSPWRARLWT